MEFDRRSLQKLQKLSRIQCKPEEEPALLDSLQRILQYIEQLNEIDTEDVAPCNHLLGELLYNVTRKDELCPLRSQKDFLANSPAHVGGMIRVPPILKSE